MMKFKSLQDIQQFLIEIERIDLVQSANEQFVPTDEMIERLFNKRKGIIQPLRNFRRSQSAKAGWRKSRHKYLKGIRGFHRSTEGKRFHRALGNYVSSRIFRGPISTSYGRENYLDGEIGEALKALSSTKTHLYIELSYYHPLTEEMELWDLIEEVIPEINIIEKKLLDFIDLDENDLGFLISICEPSAVVQSFADETGKSVAEVEKMWDEIKQSLKDDGKDPDDENFWGLLVSILKKKLGLD